MSLQFERRGALPSSFPPQASKEIISMKTFATICLLSAALIGCKKSSPQPSARGFAASPVKITLTGGPLKEVSGMADSKRNPGVLWVEEDSGNPPMIYPLSHDGKYGAGIPIVNAVNRDWEDMSLAPGPMPGVDYIYLADIGDNNQSASEYSFYRFPEPAADAASVTAYEKIRFVYADGPHDAEAFLVDPTSRDIFVITKRDVASGLYRIPYPQDTSQVSTATLVMKFNYNGVVSACLSPDGHDVIVKTYTTLYHYSRKSGDSFATTFAAKPDELTYQLEPQGEAVTFSADNSGFYTLSELPMSQPVTLNYYQRN